MIEKEINKNLPGDDSLRCQTAASRTDGDACGSKTGLGRQEEHYLIVDKF